MTRTRRLIAIALPALLCVAVSLGLASRRVPTGFQSGLALRGPSHSPAREPAFRVAAWNIHGGQGRDGAADFDRLAERLRPFDFVGLNEVRGADGSAPDQAALLGQKLERGSLFLPFERRWGRDNLGNGVLSTCAVSRWMQIPLPHTRAKGHGNLTLLTVDAAGVTVRVIVTHVDRRSDHERQFEAVSTLFLSLAEPAILMGDMNATADEPRMAELLRVPGVRDALSVSDVPQPPDRIDWILVRGLDCLRAGSERTTDSDHPLVWAELSLPRPAVSVVAQ